VTLALFSVTIALVLFGCALYVGEFVGWAQFLWVMASGTAGAAVASWVEGR